jgi:hypothetical protein
MIEDKLKVTTTITNNSAPIKEAATIATVTDDCYLKNRKNRGCEH